MWIVRLWMVNKEGKSSEISITNYMTMYSHSYNIPFCAANLWQDKCKAFNGIKTFQRIRIDEISVAWVYLETMSFTFIF